jgi:tRNA(Ile)-lysidine synthase
MNKIEEHIENLIGNNPALRLFVACSGGIDSIVLLHILKKLGKNVSAIHVNYMLRGEDSEADQVLVESTCDELGIVCHVKRVDLNAYLEKTGGNLQDTARKVRYAYFERFKLKQDFRIVLGQHADDQVETFFLNLARGGGIMGLAAMLPEYNRYLRPLLPFSKHEIIEYAVENGIQWREDKSNSSNKYNRNKLRNILIPEMEIHVPTLRKSVLTLVSAFQDTQLSLEEEVSDIVKRIQTEGILTFQEFDALNEFEITEILRQLDISVTFTNELLKLRNSQTGTSIDSNAETFKKIFSERDHFYFEKEWIPTDLTEFKLETVKTLPSKFDKNAIYLDPDKINGQLELRYWKEGDRMKPIGINGSKLISDILADAKIPSHSKRKQLVLVDTEKILWCIGHSVSREAIANTDSAIVKVSLADWNH